MLDHDVQNKVRQFYDAVGWQTTDSGFYQNARYEDLRPVSAEYIHKCHLRVNRFIKQKGSYLLDAGSGPIQYPEYLTYSSGYRFRVCADLSIVALKEARKRTGDHGLFVVADVSNLPFKNEVFDGAVSLHTFHHLPIEQQKKAYLEIHRVLQEKSKAVIVNGWTDSPLMKSSQWLVDFMEFTGRQWMKFRGKESSKHQPQQSKTQTVIKNKAEKVEPVGTFIEKMTPDWLNRQFAEIFPVQIWVWRSVNVRFLRAVIHSKTGGKFLLKCLYAMEELFPHFFGKNGQYPLIVMEKCEK